MYLLNPRASSMVSQGGWIESSSLNPKGSLKFITITISADWGPTFDHDEWRPQAQVDLEALREAESRGQARWERETGHSLRIDSTV